MSQISRILIYGIVQKNDEFIVLIFGKVWKFGKDEGVTLKN